MGHILVYDLETKRTFDEVGGYENTHLLEISVAGVYNYTDNQYYALRENQLDQFELWLEDCELLIGFNSIHFDNVVLQPYLKKVNLSNIPHLDMMKDFQDHLGFRVKLDNVASTTLAEGKSGSGLDAIRYYRLGQWDKLKSYCLDDVRVTRDVYEYGKSHGYVWYLESGTPTKIPVKWSKETPVDELIEQALVEHRQLEIIYIKPKTGPNEPTTRYTTLLDIRSIDEKRVTAFSHTDQKEKVFDRMRIFSAKLNGKSSAYQQSLI